MNLFEKKHAWILGGFEYLHADNVTADPGTGGATFRSDDVGAGVQVPYAKLMSGTDGASDVIPGDATNGLDVDVTRVIPGTSATALGKAEDAAHSSGDTGVMALAVRNDTRASLSGTDGDYSPLQLNASGDLRVDGSAVTQPVSDAGGSLTVDGTVSISGTVTVGSHAVTNAGTFATQVDGAALTALQLIDNIVAVEDAAASGGESGVPVLAVRRDVASSGVSADGDFANLSVDSTGALRVTGGGGGTQYAEDAAHSSGDTGTLALVVRKDTAATLAGTDGDYTGLIVDANGRLHVNASGAAVPITDNSGSISVDDNGGALTVDNGGTFAVQVDGAALTALQLIDDTVFAEDAAAQAGDKGIQILAVRRDANTSLVGADNDYAPLQVNADGSLKVAITAGAGSGGTSIADDAAFTPASTSITPVGGTYRSTLDAVDDGDAGAFAMTANRAMHVNLRDASGNELSSGAQYAEDAAHASGDMLMMAGAVRRDTVAVGSGTDGDNSTLNVNSVGRLWTTAVIDTALPAGTNAIGKLAANSGVDIGDVDVTSVPTDPFGANADAASATGSISAKLRFIAATGIPVTSLPNVTLAAGTNTNEVVGDAAHDAAIAGNPVRVAGRGMSADYTAVSTGDTADLLATLLGKLVTVPYALPANTWNYAAPAGGLVSTTAVTVKAAAGAGIRNYVTSLQVINSHATISTEIMLLDGAAGTVLWRGWAQAAGGGISCKFDPPLRGTANTLLEIDEVTGTATAGVLVNIQGFVAAE